MITNFTFNETSPAAAGTAASSGYVDNAANYLDPGIAGPIDDHDVIEIVAELVGATGGALDIYVQSRANDLEPWFDLVHFAQLGASAAAVNYRVSIAQHPQSTISDAPVAIGKDNTPALAAAKSVNGGAFDRVRLLMVAGASTSAGAAVKVRVYCQRARLQTS